MKNWFHEHMLGPLLASLILSASGAAWVLHADLAKLTQQVADFSDIVKTQLSDHEARIRVLEAHVQR